MRSFRFIAVLMLSIASVLGLAASHAEPIPASPSSVDAVAMPAYVPRFGRLRPIVAVVGENTFTELTDYVVPYAVLRESGVADVVALATQPGPIQMFPALKIQPQSTVDEFDARVPDGADYVIVPAVHRTEDAALLKWVKNQAGKGATIVGVCDGVWVVAHAGLLKGRKAVGHWYSFGDLQKKFPETTWIRNRRYLADGKVVTTTGVTASMPVSLALVEAIAGPARSMAVARAMGVNDWRADHDSGNFKLRTSHMYTAAVNWLSFWSHEEVGVPISEGVSDVALALVADAYSRTYRSNAVSISSSAGEVRSRGGLLIIPDRVAGGPEAPDRTLKSLAEMKPATALDSALSEISDRYGLGTSAFVALQMEYPQR